MEHIGSSRKRALVCAKVLLIACTGWIKFPQKKVELISAKTQAKRLTKLVHIRGVVRWKSGPFNFPRKASRLLTYRHFFYFYRMLVSWFLSFVHNAFRGAQQTVSIFGSVSVVALEPATIAMQNRIEKVFLRSKLFVYMCRKRSNTFLRKKCLTYCFPEKAQNRFSTFEKRNWKENGLCRK